MDRFPEAAARITLYTLLAHGFNYPDQEIIELLTSGELTVKLGECLNVLGKSVPEAELGRIGERYGRALHGTHDKHEFLLELEREYTHIFFASRPRQAYLFESVYNEGKLYQDSTFQIARLYHEAGLKVDEEFKLPPDHIAVEFEFMAYLAYSEIEAAKAGHKENEAYARELQERVLKEHLTPFALHVAERLTQHAKTAFYLGVAAITKAVVSGQ
jgi:putative dimethyl sulfoxide reductase chaperone